MSPLSSCEEFGSVLGGLGGGEGEEKLHYLTVAVEACIIKRSPTLGVNIRRGRVFIKIGGRGEGIPFASIGSVSPNFDTRLATTCRSPSRHASWREEAERGDDSSCDLVT